VNRVPTDNRAVVFAYSGVGVRGLSALLAQDFDVRLVVTHEDDPAEMIWFDSVAALAGLNGIPVIAPDDPNEPKIVALVRKAKPDWLFSFYYRRLLAEDLLSAPTQGAYNLHGSLLPRFRGRAPVNWAVLKGATETGASLHRMIGKADAGRLVDQQAVPILPNDTAMQVYNKVACAAEIVLMRSLPALLDGTAVETALDVANGSYFGGRTPEDGRIDWGQPALHIHNLVRAVAPPYPGAFFDSGGRRVFITGSYYRHSPARGSSVRIYWEQGTCWADCIDSERIQLLGLAVDDNAVDEAGFHLLFGRELVLG